MLQRHPLYHGRRVLGSIIIAISVIAGGVLITFLIACTKQTPVDVRLPHAREQAKIGADSVSPVGLNEKPFDPKDFTGQGVESGTGTDSSPIDLNEKPFDPKDFTGQGVEGR